MNMHSIHSKKQESNEILNLEISYTNLNKALSKGYRYEIIEAIVYALLSNPSYCTKLRTSIDNIFIKQYGYNFSRNINWGLISDKDVILNAEGCLKGIEDILKEHTFYNKNYKYAKNILYKPNHTFEKEDVLYQNKQNEQLKVNDLLKIVKYSIDIAEAIEPGNENYAKANAVITTLQGIEDTLNNKPEDKPVNKMLHLTTNFISSVVKSSLKNDDSKRNVTITTSLIDLAIDFFCKK